MGIAGGQINKPGETSPVALFRETCHGIFSGAEQGFGQWLRGFWIKCGEWLDVFR